MTASTCPGGGRTIRTQAYGRGRHLSVHGNHRFPVPGVLALATAIAEGALGAERAWGSVGTAGSRRPLSIEHRVTAISSGSAAKQRLRELAPCGSGGFGVARHGDGPACNATDKSRSPISSARGFQKSPADRPAILPTRFQPRSFRYTCAPGHAQTQRTGPLRKPGQVHRSICIRSKQFQRRSRITLSSRSDARCASQPR